MTALHRRLRRLRLAAGLSQEALAGIAGVHKSAVSHWERGCSAPRAGMMARVAKALGVTVGELYGEAA